MVSKNIRIIIFSAAIVFSTLILRNAYIHKYTTTDGKINVTGLAEVNFTSDLIVWEGEFSRENSDLKTAYAELVIDKQAIVNYFITKGINAEAIIFEAVNTIKNTKNNYDTNGQHINTELTGYTLLQKVKIESKDVVRIDKIAREVTELLNQGINFYSMQPRYYYTKLEDLKIALVAKATENARIRAEKIAQNAGAKLGQLTDGDVGIFQIIGQNSDEDYSWGGTYNVSAKNKTASITMKLKYRTQ